jgi:hypothetical protein
MKLLVKEGINTTQNSGNVRNFDGLCNIEPKPFAFTTNQTRRTAAIISTIGAAQFSNFFTASIPQ